MNEIQLLKEGQEGYGLLVETDAGIISNDLTINNKKIFEDLNSKYRRNDFDGHFYIDCKLQEADVLNRNGRVYPREILAKQIDEYQKLINDYAALNEADHPECHRETAEVFTESGWKLIKDVVVGEKVFTLNTETNQIELQPVLTVINEDYNGEMISLKGKYMDLLVTPNHRFYVNNNKKEKFFITAQEILDNNTNSLFIPNNSLWDNEFEINQIDIETIKVEKQNYNGKVVCIETPNSTFLVRDNGYALWNGNSVTISLQNVSHRIAKTWWSGNAVYGTLDIIVSDSFMRDGIGWCVGDKIALYLQRNLKLGISSRGLGSVKKVGGKNIVQDDFELICFDLVATPSTPNAYLFLETKNDNLQESVNIQNNNVKKYDDSIRKIIGG
jgi:hypothetical protein